MYSTVLLCHPDTPCAVVQEIVASIATPNDGTLKISYTLKGDLDQVRMSDEAFGTDPIWQHTCFELFLRATNDSEYYEFNFSPAGPWASYGFRDYRDGASIRLEGLDPKITVDRKADQLRLVAEMPLDRLPGIDGGVQLSLGVSAVIEQTAGNLCYWAIKHPQGKPDFHHADNFAIQLELPITADRNQHCAANA